MLYRALHTTTYTYSKPVALCYNEVHLRPRNGGRQNVHWTDLRVEPAPGRYFSRKDYFGNETTFFAVHEAHSRMAIAAESVVEVRPAPAVDTGASPAWEQVKEVIRTRRDRDTLDAFQYVFPSKYVKTGADFSGLALPSFPAGRPFLSAVQDLSSRIHAQFRYAPRTTTVGTPVEETLRERHGVCQDFAHVMISSLRSLGLPARYVSGYLRSGRDTVGAEGSHAWVSVYCPKTGWFDIDPTNDVVPGEGHITLAYGRDYGDVTPVAGIAVGGGDQEIEVTVGVVPEPH